MDVVEVGHPLAAVRLTGLRDEATSPAAFRRLLAELSTLLLIEATSDLAVERIAVTTPLETTAGSALTRPPVIVPVLRAALGMLDAALTLLPEAEVGFVGLARDEVTKEPATYLDTLRNLGGAPVLVLDPMLATGGSAVTTLELVAERHPGPITMVCALAAPEGIERVRSSGLAVRIVTASIDDRLDERSFIRPGLGDAGDRQFGIA